MPFKKAVPYRWERNIICRVKTRKFERAAFSESYFQICLTDFKLQRFFWEVILCLGVKMLILVLWLNLDPRAI